MPPVLNRMKNVLSEMQEHLESQIIPFWMERSIDSQFGGFRTCFDEKGNPLEESSKVLVSQARLLWAMSSFAQRYPGEQRYRTAAQQGFDFLVAHFWDDLHGGWVWKVKQDGGWLDAGKVLYGHCFVIYALCGFHALNRNPESLRLALKTFEIIQTYASDTLNGGYYENFERNWALSEAGMAGGDRKTIDLNTHLVEAFTVLAATTHQEVHVRKLEEICQLVLNRMVNRTEGCVYNHFDAGFTPIPPILIRRSWNAVREEGKMVKSPANSTPFGYNIVLSWLLNRAATVLGKPDDFYSQTTQMLVDYTLEHGFDHEKGGLYQDGTHTGIVLSYNKDFWQSCEALIGYLDAYQKFGFDKYLEAFYLTWDFACNHFINPKTGEWNQLVTRDGKLLIGDFNAWRSPFHTGRAMLECTDRLRALINDGERASMKWHS